MNVPITAKKNSKLIFLEEKPTFLSRLKHIIHIKAKITKKDEIEAKEKRLFMIFDV